MWNWTHSLASFLRNEEGATAVEYAVMMVAVFWAYHFVIAAHFAHMNEVFRTVAACLEGAR